MSGCFRSVSAWASILVVSIYSPHLEAQDESEEDLTRLRAEIAELERDLERQISRRDDGMAQLRQIEVSLAATRAELEELADAIDAQSQRRDEIEAERRAATARLGDEQEALGEQLRMSYMTGRQELIKLLLSQENPSDFGRMLVYYNYLNEHRSQQIAEVDARLRTIVDLARESDEVRRELETLRETQEAEVEQLDRQRSEREQLLAELNRDIDASGTRIERMREEEARLTEVLVRLSELLEEFPVSSDAPFSEQKGNLTWPIDGELAAEFGDYRDSGGRVRWTGVLLEAEAGTVVRAVYHGRVILSQWWPGMGLLTILEHGEGYLSLYGHNAVLLREPGDWVEPGDPIAEVGNTGGQLVTGVFFGITEDTEPVDPADWMR